MNFSKIKNVIGLALVFSLSSAAVAATAVATTTSKPETSTKIAATSVKSETAVTTATTDTTTTAAPTDEAVAKTESTETTATTATTDNTDNAVMADDVAPTAEKDPLEGFNRIVFTFNDKIDIYFLKPIATLYNKIMPKPLNQGIHNVFENLNTVPTIANDVLQANFYQASNDIWRLGINTTIGIGGLFDMAERMQLEPYANDFGLTLARWGYQNSNYLVLPFFGPNTIRDGLVGLPVDYFVFSVYPYIKPPSTRYQVYILGVIDKRAQLLKFQDVMDEAALDKYIFVRNAYLQRRAFRIEQNQHRSCCERYQKNEPVADASPAALDDTDSSIMADLNAGPDATIEAEVATDTVDSTTADTTKKTEVKEVKKPSSSPLDETYD